MPDLDPEDFVRDIRHPLVGSLALCCGDTGVAEELAQEALAKAWLRSDRLDDPKAWTYRTAFNLAPSWGRPTFRRTPGQPPVVGGRGGRTRPGRCPRRAGGRRRAA